MPTDHDRIRRYIDGSEDISDLLKEHLAKIESANQALSDLDHFLELEDLTEAETKIVIEYRRRILTQRRVSKDMECVINQILPRQIEGRTTTDRFEYAIRRLGDRYYTPRQLTVKDVLGRDPNTDSIAATTGG